MIYCPDIKTVISKIKSKNYKFSKMSLPISYSIPDIGSIGLVMFVFGVVYGIFLSLLVYRFG